MEPEKTRDKEILKSNEYGNKRIDKLTVHELQSKLLAIQNSQREQDNLSGHWSKHKADDDSRKPVNSESEYTALAKEVLTGFEVVYAYGYVPKGRNQKMQSQQPVL